MRLRPGAVNGTGAFLSAARDAGQLWRLPRPARRFYRAALWAAIRTRDGHALRVSLPPRELSALLRLAAGRSRVVELGTACGWTALALATCGPRTRVVTLDPRVSAGRETYVGLVGPEVRARVAFVARGGEEPPDPIDVDLLYIDTNHKYDLVLACFERWLPQVVSGGVVVFDDFDHPVFPGPARVVRDLGLEGERVGRMFVWTKP